MALTQADARARSKVVERNSVRYALTLRLTGGAPEFAGEVTVAFRLAGQPTTDTLFLDCGAGVRLVRLVLNGVVLDVEAGEAGLDADAHRLWLADSVLDGLRGGESVRLTVGYVGSYDHDGDGFHQYFDPADGAEYLYTNFEPWAAHRLFPSFDQPDIKAARRCPERDQDRDAARDAFYLDRRVVWPPRFLLDGGWWRWKP